MDLLVSTLAMYSAVCVVLQKLIKSRILKRSAPERNESASIHLQYLVFYSTFYFSFLNPMFPISSFAGSQNYYDNGRWALASGNRYPVQSSGNFKPTSV